LFNANPNFAERFPGGILQFVQAIGQLPEDVVEDMMMMEMMGGGDAQNAGVIMPGGLDILDLNEVAGMVPVPVGGAAGLPQEEDEMSGNEEEEEEEEDISVRFFNYKFGSWAVTDLFKPIPRVIMTLLGRFWGRPAAPEESSSEEEPRDNTGVD